MPNQLDRKSLADGVALACAGLLALTPLCMELDGAARWNMWLTAYAIATVATASLTAEADWTSRAEVALGVWLLASLWLFDVRTHEVGALVHTITGLMLCICAVAELHAGHGDPPLLHRPGGASRPLALDRTIADARRRARALAVRRAERARQPVRPTRHRASAVLPYKPNTRQDMTDLNKVRATVYRANIHRYRRLLETQLTDLERQFIERRLAEETRSLEDLNERCRYPGAVAGSGMRVARAVQAATSAGA